MGKHLIIGESNMLEHILSEVTVASCSGEWSDKEWCKPVFSLLTVSSSFAVIILDFYTKPAVVLRLNECVLSKMIHSLSCDQ